MPFTVIAYEEARETAVTTLSELAGVSDDHVRVVGDDIYVPSLNRLIGSFAHHGTGTAAGDITGAQLASPSLRRIFLQDMGKLTDLNASPATHQINMYPQNPLPLDVNEALNALMTNGAVVGAKGLVGVWLADGAISPVTGEIRTVKCTTTFTPTADAWTSGDLTFTQDLPVGRYRVVGARCIGGDTQGLFRFIFVGGIWRPGGVIQKDVADPDISWFRNGQLGVWGEFDQLTPPKIEVLELAAVANPTVYLDLIKVA